jgi:NAD(P)-dependent dehydrogenase (short-subunit alcohol dehydrogenase family)
MYSLFRPELAAPTRDDFAEKATESQLLDIPWVEPVDISNALLFLVAETGRYITGVSLPVDGGLTQK